MSHRSVSAKLLQNTLFNGCGSMANYLAVLVLTPLIFSHLGAERFGLWALTTLLAGQFGLLDLGFGAALTKYVAEYKTTNRLQMANSPFTAALCFYALVSAGLLAVLWHFRSPVFRFFFVPDSFWSESHYLIPGAVLIFFLTSILGVLQSMFNGLQEVAFTNAAAVLQGVCMIGLTVALFHAGFGFRGVICAAVLSLLVAVTFLLVFVIRLIPSLKLAPFIGKSEFLPVLRFGATMQLVVIASVVVAYADRALISHFLGLVLLAKYQLGYTVIGAMRGAVLLLASAVVPATSDLAAKNDRGTLQSLYWRGTKYTILVALAIGAAIITLAPEIARAWLGHDDPLVALIFRFLATGQVVYVITGLGASMCRGMGLVALEAKFGVWLTVLQTTIGTVTVRRFGLLGLLCSTALVTTGTSVIFLYKFHRSIQRRYRSFSWPHLLFTPAKAAALASCLVALSSSLVLVSGQSRFSSVCLVSFDIMLFALIYALVILRSNYLDAFDRQLFSRLPGGSLWTVLLSQGQQ